MPQKPIHDKNNRPNTINEIIPQPAKNPTGFLKGIARTLC